MEELVPPDGKDTLVGFSDAVRPENDVEATRLIVPEKPPTDAIITVGVEDPPTGTLTGAGFAVILKSDPGAETVTVIVADRDANPLLPDTTTAYWPGALLELA